jgi:ferritin
MIKPKIQQALNTQINRELYSAYLYLSMAAYFESLSLKGFSNWMTVQAQEEMVHVMKFYAYLIDRGGRVTLTGIEAPPAEWNCPFNAFEEVHKHEQKVTGYINGLVTLAIAEEDHATHNFLQWFVSEQVEEEASADAVIQKLRLMQDAPGGLFIMDQELAKRVFTPPPAASGASA